MTIYKTIDHLPEIGEAILVEHAGEYFHATVISMAECKKLEPSYFGEHDLVNDKYPPNETIRAFKYATPCNGRVASFCIMRFRDETHPLGAEYNRNVCQPAKTVSNPTGI